MRLAGDAIIQVSCRCREVLQLPCLLWYNGAPTTESGHALSPDADEGGGRTKWQ